MGIVYEAIQLSLGRRVALKVLPLAGALDPRHLQRFRNEAQAAAQLHHTNIVPVYAVGYERSVHFYAMQLIEGQSLAEVIAEMRRAEKSTSSSDASADAAPTVGSPPPTISPDPSAAGATNGATVDESEREHRRRVVMNESRQRAVVVGATVNNLSAIRNTKKATFFQTVARLGMQTAEALDYAHQIGVIHRDIKPANLLLDVHGTIWITDFGLAQLHADSGLTQPGDVLGTLRYMSPEQASGNAVVLDQRTDVYSLGMTLYELLTLQRALPGTTREQLLHEIGSVDPRPARNVDRAIPVELETIVAKAVSKDAADRYPTAKALADDLRRFLQNEPILARPPTLRELAVKWSRRHKSATIAAIVVLSLAVVGSCVTTILVAREATEARLQRDRADASLKRALQAVDFFTVAAEDLPKDPQFLRYRQYLLDAAIENYRSFVREREQDDAVRTEVNTARSRATVMLEEVRTVDHLFRLLSFKRLLQVPAVQDELKLSDEQKSRVEEIARSQMPRPNDGKAGASSAPSTATSRPSLTQMSPGERQTHAQDEVERLNGQFEHVLTAFQYNRLRQIARQAEGVFCFSDADVGDALELSPQQKEQIRLAQREFSTFIGGFGGGFGHMHDRGGPGGPPPGDSPRSKPPERHDDDKGPKLEPFDRKAQDAAVAKIVAGFSSLQHATWQKLIGDPFAGDFAQLEGFGGFGGSMPPPPPRHDENNTGGTTTRPFGNHHFD